MKVELVECSNKVGHCNFCHVGKLRKEGVGLDYPYTKVLHICQDDNVNGAAVNICPYCAAKLAGAIRENIMELVSSMTITQEMKEHYAKTSS